MTNRFQNSKHDSKTAQPESEQKCRSPKDRRKGWGLLAYYLAGGVEHRRQIERRDRQKSLTSGLPIEDTRIVSIHPLLNENGLIACK